MEREREREEERKREGRPCSLLVERSRVAQPRPPAPPPSPLWRGSGLWSRGGYGTSRRAGERAAGWVCSCWVCQGRVRTSSSRRSIVRSTIDDRARRGQITRSSRSSRWQSRVLSPLHRAACEWNNDERPGPVLQAKERESAIAHPRTRNVFSFFRNNVFCGNFFLCAESRNSHQPRLDIAPLARFRGPIARFGADPLPGSLPLGR